MWRNRMTRRQPSRAETTAVSSRVSRYHGAHVCASRAQLTTRDSGVRRQNHPDRTWRTKYPSHQHAGMIPMGLSERHVRAQSCTLASRTELQPRCYHAGRRGFAGQSSTWRSYQVGQGQPVQTGDHNEGDRLGPLPTTRAAAGPLPTKLKAAVSRRLRVPPISAWRTEEATTG